MATETGEAPNANVNGDNNVRALYDVVRGFPRRAVAELLAIGVCTRCVLRLFGVRDGVYYRCPLSQSMLSSVLSDSIDLDIHGDLGEPAVCRLCLGVLQFSFCEDKKVVMKDSAEELVVYISSLIRNQGYEIDSFSLEVSIPPIILDNEHTVLLHLKTKYESELWFQERSLPECTSVKDALKVSLTEALETMLDCKLSVGTFRIRLTYTYPIQSETVENSTEGGRDSKRLKTGTVHTNDHGIQCIKSSTSESGVERTIESSEPLEQINEPCSFEFFCTRSQIYFGGRYVKFSRNVSQTRWIIDDERMGEASVEEIIGSNILPICRGDNYKFHAAGREDIDVRMLGSGRPFLIEVQNARHVPSEESVKDLQRKINNLQNKLVGVKNLKLVGSQSWDLMREGEAEKQKQYTALVWTSRILTDENLQPISSMKDMHILQRTPIRVLHRRSPLERERIIHWMRVERIVGSPQYFLLHLCTQAGTYIKEFVHGDLGRTQPSFGSILGTRAEILQLDVTDVKMDCFLTE